VTCQARHKISAAASQQSPWQYRISSRDQAPSAQVILPAVVDGNDHGGA